MTLPPPPGGAGDRANRPHPRDNGLTADHFVALIDVDPRVAVPLLEALARAGIAAYAAPTPGRVGGYLDVKLPDRPTDRLWVDGGRRTEAGEIVRRELASHHDDPGTAGAARPGAVDGPGGLGGFGGPAADERDAFDAIVAGFNEPLAGDARPWPAAEDIVTQDAALPPSRVVRYPVTEPDPPQPALPEHVEAYLDEHFVPEPPPPLPRPTVATFWALVGLVGGLVILAGSALLHWELDPVLQGAAALGILGGFGALVWRMHDATDDDDPDDGAVV